jgi:pimeloyl-ACP methyl ester carboxylesterase
LRITTDDGVELAALAAGSAEAPGLLLVHGFGGAKEDFADHVDALADRHRVVVFDHRGHGASDAPEDPAAYSLNRLAADTLAVADALGLRDLRLLGHSMGGMVARRLVLARPGRVDAVVFMDTSPGPPPGLDRELVAYAVDLVHAEGMAALKRAQDGLDILGSPAYRRVLAERPGFRAFTEQKWEALSPVMWTTLALEIVTQPDETPRLGGLRQPALVVVGEQDETFLDPSRAIAGAVPDARLAVIPDAGHSPQFENPDVWYRELSGFLDALPGETNRSRARMSGTAKRSRPA